MVFLSRKTQTMKSNFVCEYLHVRATMSVNIRTVCISTLIYKWSLHYRMEGKTVQKNIFQTFSLVSYWSTVKVEIRNTFGLFVSFAVWIWRAVYLLPGTTVSWYLLASISCHRRNALSRFHVQVQVLLSVLYLVHQLTRPRVKRGSSFTLPKGRAFPSTHLLPHCVCAT